MQENSSIKPGLIWFNRPLDASQSDVIPATRGYEGLSLAKPQAVAIATGEQESVDEVLAGLCDK